MTFEELVEHMREDPDHPTIWLEPVSFEELQAIHDQWHAGNGPHGLYSLEPPYPESL